MDSSLLRLRSSVASDADKRLLGPVIEVPQRRSPEIFKCSAGPDRVAVNGVGCRLMFAEPRAAALMGKHRRTPRALAPQEAGSEVSGRECSTSRKACVVTVVTCAAEERDVRVRRGGCWLLWSS